MEYIAQGLAFIWWVMCALAGIFVVALVWVWLRFLATYFTIKHKIFKKKNVRK